MNARILAVGVFDRASFEDEDIHGAYWLAEARHPLCQDGMTIALTVTEVEGARASIALANLFGLEMTWKSISPSEDLPGQLVKKVPTEQELLRAGWYEDETLRCSALHHQGFAFYFLPW